MSCQLREQRDLACSVSGAAAGSEAVLRQGGAVFCDKGWWIELILHNSLFSDSHLFLPAYSAILGIAYSWEDFIMHFSFNHFLKCLLDFPASNEHMQEGPIIYMLFPSVHPVVFTPLLYNHQQGIETHYRIHPNSYGFHQTRWTSSRLASILPCVPGGDERSHRIAGADEVSSEYRHYSYLNVFWTQC